MIKTGCFDVENGPFFRRALMVAACFGNYKLSAQVVEHIWKTLLEKCRQARRAVERRDFGRKQQQQIANKTNGKSFRNSIQYQSCQFSNTHNTTAQNDNKTLKATNFYSLVMAHTVLKNLYKNLISFRRDATIEYINLKYTWFRLTCVSTQFFNMVL